MKLNKDSLVKIISEKLPKNISQNDISLIATSFFDNISKGLVNSERIEIRGFGSISLRNRKVPLDPRSNTSENTVKSNCRSVYFRMAKDLAQKLNSK